MLHKCFNIYSGSFQSAVSSIETVNSSLTGFIGRKQAIPVPAVVKKSNPDSDKIFSSKVTKIQVDFSIRRLLLEVEEKEKPLFYFKLEDLNARLTAKNYNIHGQFSIGGCQCHQTKFRMPDGSPVALLSTTRRTLGAGGQLEGDTNLLLVTIQKLEEKSPDWAGVHLAVTAKMSLLWLFKISHLFLVKEYTISELTYPMNPVFV